MPPEFLNTQAIFKQVAIEYTCTNTPYYLTEISSVGIHFILNEIVFCSGISYCPTISPYNHFSKDRHWFQLPKYSSHWWELAARIEVRMRLFYALSNSEFIFNNFASRTFSQTCYTWVTKETMKWIKKIDFIGLRYWRTSS